MGGQYSAAKFYDAGPKTPAGESSSDVSLFQQLLQHIENETKELLGTITNMKMGSMGQIDDKSSRAILADGLRSAEMKLHTLNDELCNKSVDLKTRYDSKEHCALQRETQPMYNISEKFETLQKQLVTSTERLSFVESQLEVMKGKEQVQKQTIDEQAVRSEQYKKEAEKQKLINNDLLTRLSKVTGDKLNTDNPNIADLSDPNRPTKIAEMISELYDNEWTNAFEALQTRKVDDKEIVNVLLETFMDVYNFCKGKSIELMSLTEKSIKHLFDDFDKTVKETNSKLKSATLSPKVQGNFNFSRDNAKASLLNLLFMKWQDKSKATEFEEIVDITSVEDVLPKIEEEVKKVRKNVGLALVPMVTKAYLKPRWNKLCVHALKPYIKKCVHVAWLMCVQTPPMAIAALPKHGEKLDTNLYREYSRRGQTVDFVVWPVVLLKEPQNEMLSVMTKGVAEVKEL